MVLENNTPQLTFHDLKTKISVPNRHDREMDLMFRLMIKKRLSPVEGQLYFLLRNKHEKYYAKFLKELFPFRYEIYMEERIALGEIQRN